MHCSGLRIAGPSGALKPPSNQSGGPLGSLRLFVHQIFREQRPINHHFPQPQTLGLRHGKPDFHPRNAQHIVRFRRRFRNV